MRGSDSDLEMVQHAQRAHPSLTFSQESLPNLPYGDGEFGLVAANFVINHAPKPAQFVRELARITEPEGLTIMTIWPSMPTAAINQLWARVVRESRAIPLAGARLPAEDDFERTAPGFARLLQAGGLRAVTSTDIHWTFRVDAEALWNGVEAGVGNVGATYLKKDQERRVAMRAAYEDLTGLGDLEFPAHAVLGTAAGAVEWSGWRWSGAGGAGVAVEWRWSGAGMELR